MLAMLFRAGDNPNIEELARRRRDRLRGFLRLPGGNLPHGTVRERNDSGRRGLRRPVAEMRQLFDKRLDWEFSGVRQVNRENSEEG